MAAERDKMNLQTLIDNIQFVANMITVGVCVIGFSAVTFGFYDIKHLKWTGDLKTMITTLLGCSTTLIIIIDLKQYSFLSIQTLIAYFFIATGIYFASQLKNPKLSHEKRKQKNLIKKAFYWIIAKESKE